LTSAPEEDYLSVHVECSNAYTQSLAAALGCKFEQHIDKRAPYTSAVVGIDHQPRRLDVDPTIRRLLPSVFIDGPFGGTSTDLFEFESVILAALGDRIELFASILKSIWYRMNYPSQKCCIRKVYFLWACNDFCHCEWFISLLIAIEAQDLDHNIEIYTYVTSTCVSKDVMTAFRTPTKLGVPDWGATLNLSRQTYGPKQTCFIFNKLDRMGLKCTVL
jgi:NADPH oxidase